VAIALTAFAVIGILVSPNVRIGWIGIDTLAIAAACVFAVAWMRRSPDSRFLDGQVLPVPIGWGDTGARTPSGGDEFSLAAVGILVSAPFLAYSAREIATATGVGETFVDTTLLALATSLPELIAAVAAVRIGAQDLAVGNLFGSNCFNMAALLFADLAYSPGPCWGRSIPVRRWQAEGDRTREIGSIHGSGRVVDKRWANHDSFRSARTGSARPRRGHHVGPTSGRGFAAPAARCVVLR
jgi:Ca2+/Na+ antiporter